MAETPVLEVSKLFKRFGDLTVLHGIDLTIREGEFLTLLGPSGCGKTSTVRVLAGFLSPTEGRVFMDGRTLRTAHPRDGLWGWCSRTMRSSRT